MLDNRYSILDQKHCKSDIPVRQNSCPIEKNCKSDIPVRQKKIKIGINV
jgi:hypothetical protein